MKHTIPLEVVNELNLDVVSQAIMLAFSMLGTQESDIKST